MSMFHVRQQARNAQPKGRCTGIIQAWPYSRVPKVAGCLRHTSPQLGRVPRARDRERLLESIKLATHNKRALWSLGIQQMVNRCCLGSLGWPGMEWRVIAQNRSNVDIALAVEIAIGANGVAPARAGE